jgi:transcriptional regulatory protein RtcR
MKKQTVVVGLLGTVLDRGHRTKRWNHWRPSVGLCMQEDLRVDEYHLVYDQSHLTLARQIEADVAQVSPETRMELHQLSFENPWDFEEAYGVMLDFFNTFDFDTSANEYLVHITTGTHVLQICLFLLAESRHFPGKLLQTSPDVTHRKSPSGTYTVIDLDLSRYDKLASRFRQEAKDDISFLKSGIETRNEKFNNLIEMIECVAMRSREPILLMGPTGAGKSKLAGRIYQLKKQRGQLTGRFVEINCATLRGDAAMSALFGHKKGSFTGAVQDRPGLLKSAEQGMVFLDEIAELGLDEQAMLLRAIEEKVFTPLGADTETGSDFQLICGTNKDLHQCVAARTFREDLMARINMWTFSMPGLKERPEDIEPNLDYELKRYEEAAGTRVTFNKEARALFIGFAVSTDALWSASFRDLNGAVMRMCTLAEGGRITAAEVGKEIRRLKENWRTHHAADRPETGTLDRILAKTGSRPPDPFERVQLAYVVDVCRGSRSLSEAGRKLFTESRKLKSKPNDADRLKKYLAKYGIAWEDIRPEFEPVKQTDV